MKIPKISIQYFPNIDITNKFPAFLKKSVAQEMQIIKYHFKSLFDDMVVSKLDIDSDMLKDCGIFKIGRTPAEGIGIIGYRFNYLMVNSKPNIFELSYLNKITGDVEKVITIGKTSFFERTKLPQDNTVGENVEEILMEIDSKLMGLKHKISKQIPRPYIPTGEKSAKLNKINQMLATQKTITKITNPAKLDEQGTRLLKSIQAGYAEIKNVFMNFNNPTTASNVRTYYKNYNSAESNRATLMFNNIGPNGEDIATTFLIHKGKSYTAIRVEDKNKAPLSFVISSDRIVQKNLPFVKKKTACSKKRKDAIPDFYQPEEFDRLNINQYLDCINNEFRLFKEHAINWRKQQLDFVSEHTNENVGSTSRYNSCINKIFNTLEDLKGNIRKHYEYLTSGDEYLRSNNVNIEFSRRGVRFEKITPEKYDLRLTFPSTQGQRATQILVMDGDTIKESYYIIDEKLLKLDFKNVNTAFVHTDRQRYYYPQDYIDASRLDEYLNLMAESLKYANNVMKNKI